MGCRTIAKAYYQKRENEFCLMREKAKQCKIQQQQQRYTEKRTKVEEKVARKP